MSRIKEINNDIRSFLMNFLIVGKKKLENLRTQSFQNTKLQKKTLNDLALKIILKLFFGFPCQ
jgi:hypothetical protein